MMRHPAYNYVFCFCLCHCLCLPRHKCHSFTQGTESCQARGITHCLIVHAGMCLSIWMISNKLILVSYDHPNFANHPRLKYTPVYMCPNLQCRLKLIAFQSIVVIIHGLAFTSPMGMLPEHVGCQLMETFPVRCIICVCVRVCV